MVADSNTPAPSSVVGAIPAISAPYHCDSTLRLSSDPQTLTSGSRQHAVHVIPQALGPDQVAPLLIQTMSTSSWYSSGPLELYIQYNVLDVGNDGVGFSKGIGFGNELKLDGLGPDIINTFSRIEMVGGLRPVVFWLEDDGSTVKGKGVLLQAGADVNTIALPGQDDYFELKFDGAAPKTGLIDFTSCTLDDITHLYWVNAGETTVNTAVVTFSPENTQSTPPVVSAPSIACTIETPEQLVFNGIDACVAHTQPHTVADTEAQIYLTVLCYATPTQEQPLAAQNVFVALMRHDASADKYDLLRWYTSESLPGWGARWQYGASIRIAWGNLPFVGAEQQYDTGLTVAICCVFNNNLDYYQDLKLPNLGPVQIACISLENADFSISNWTGDLTPTVGYFNNVMYGADMVRTNKGSVNLVPAYGIPEGGSLARQNYGLLLTNFAAAWNDRGGFYGLNFVRAGSAYKMFWNKGTPKKTNKDTSAWTDDDYAAAVSTWQLIGIITGAPPVPKEGGAEWAATVEHNKSKTITSNITRTSEVMCKGKVSAFGFKSSLSVGVSKSTGTINTVEIDTGATHEQLSNYDFNRITKIYTPLDYTIGWFLFYMPTYTVHNFGFTPMSATESNANSVGFDLIVQGESTEEVSPEFGPVPFCLEDPSKNIDPKNKFQKALTKGWGTSAKNKLSTFEINDWNNISPFFSNGTEKLFDMTGMKFGEATLKSCITTTSGTTKTTSGKLTIKISLNSEFIKDIFSVSSSLSISTSVTTEYSTAVSYSMKVEWGLKNSGPEYSTWYCDPHLLVYQEGGQNNLPEMLKYQTPWLLTWVAGAD